MNIYYYVIKIVEYSFSSQNLCGGKFIWKTIFKKIKFTL